MPPVKNVLVVLRPKLDLEYESVLPNLIRWLSRRKRSVFFLYKEKERITKIFRGDVSLISFIESKELYSRPDLIITLGGDGTLIGIGRNVTTHSPPIFGVNMGHLGFITEFSKSEFFDELEHTIKGNYILTFLPLYKVSVKRKDREIFKGTFLNDAVINNNLPPRMVTLSVNASREHVYNLTGDGLIISSSIGSTAYSLAAGGPIIHPNVNAMVLTPICAHSLTYRPLVIPDKTLLEIKSAKKEDIIKITLDGQSFFTLDSQDLITIVKIKSRHAKLIKNPTRTYFQTLKEKFIHGIRDLK